MSAVTTPAEPLEIYECPACGSQMMHMPFKWRQYEHFIPDRGGQTCHVAPVPVPVIRAEGVRPLYDLAQLVLSTPASRSAREGLVSRATAVLGAFPAPKGWER